MFEWCGYKWTPEMEGGRIIHPDSPWMWYGIGGIMICSNNILELVIRENPRDVKYWDGTVYHPTLEVPVLRSLEDFSYGTFEAQVQLPEGTRLWPSFWTSGSGNWPPEIDILEAWSDDSGSYFKWTIPQFPYICPSWKTTTNVHYNDTSMNHQSIGTRNIAWTKQHKDPTTDFIDYKCVWTPENIVFYADGKKIREAGPDVSKALVSNLKDPQKGYQMNVIFNVWCEDPKRYRVKQYTPMKIKNFTYTPYTIYYRP